MFAKLSYSICEQVPIAFGNTGKTKFVPRIRIANGDPVNATELNLFTHNGTHRDAPGHFNPEGEHVDELHVEDWVFNNPKTR